MDTNLFALWPIAPFGGDPEGDDGGSNDGGSQGDSGAAAGGAAQGGAQQGDQSGSGASDSGGADDDDDDDEFDGYSAKELKRLLKDTTKSKKEVEKARDALQKKQTEAERAKNDENTNLKNDLASLKDENAALRATVTRQAIIGAIRDDNRFEWFDPTMVAQQLDPDVVKVDDNGKVEGMKAQLTKVAKDHPFLLKKDNTQGGQQQNNGGTGSGTSGPTGFQPGQGGASNGGGEPDRKKLAEDYPALAARI